MTEGLERKMEKGHKMLIYLGGGTGFLKDYSVQDIKYP